MLLPYARRVLLSLPLFLAALLVGPAAGAQDLVITGIIDGPLSGGTPKALELYATDDIADLSAYGIAVAGNGNASPGAPSYSLSGSATEGQFLYLATEVPNFTAFFGFAPTFGDAPLFINGDDAVELYFNGAVVDAFGEVGTDGTGQPWEHLDGWAYRMDGVDADDDFDASDWVYSGVDALDGSTTNANATPPFPTASYSPGGMGGPGGNGSDIVVTTSMDGGVMMDGLCSLREAVQSANTNSAVGGCTAGTDDEDEITFAATVIAPIQLTNGEITITDGLSLDGSTMLGRVTVDAQGNSRIFDVTSDADVAFTSLVLRNGNSGAGGSAAPNAGGAVDLKSGSDATFTDVDVLDSVAGINGGGIHGAGDTDIVITASASGSSTIRGNVAQGNDAGMGGGGVWGAGSVTITGGVLIRDNAATGTAGSGGGVFNFGGTLSINGATIRNNRANRAGGGIEDFGDDDGDVDVTLTDVTVTDNVIADAAPGNGGGFHSGGGDATVSGGVFSRNVAVEGGGLWSSGTITIDGTAVTRNTATGDDADHGGGGFYSQGSTATISDTFFEDNRASGTSGSGGNVLVNGGTFSMTGGELDEGHANRAGGGIEVAAGSATLDGVRVTMNDAGTNPGNGGGLHAGGDTDVTVNGGVFSQNTAVEGGGLWTAGTLEATGTGVVRNVASGTDADQGGGGFYNQAGTVTLSEVIFERNTAVEGSGSGGGVLVNGGTFSMTGGELDENRSSRAGGGIEVASGTVTLDGVRVWMNDAGTSPGNGGGLHAGGDTDVTVTDVAMSENTAVEGGGLWTAGELTVDGSAIYLNVASGDDADNGGGGFYNQGGRATITGSRIYENRATGASGSGGGILNNGGSLTVSDTEINVNTANRAGGAIEDRAGDLQTGLTVMLTGVEMHENDGGANPGNGGALHITGAGRVTVDNSSVRENVAANEGGGLWNSGLGSLAVSYTVVARNESETGGGLYQQEGDKGIILFSNGLVAFNTAETGGGLALDGGTVQMENSTISGNEADIGGGVATQSGRVLLSSVTVAGNTAETAGGGLVNMDVDNPAGGVDDGEAENLSIDNTILADNTAPFGADFAAAIMSRGYNLIETTDDGTIEMDAGAAGDLIGVDARLRPLSDNGGPTATHALRSDSPAINAGWTALEIDQRGVERRGSPDIGAFESDAAPTADDDFASEFAPGEEYKMTAPAPNPFQGTASFRLAVRVPQSVRVALYDVVGREVRVLHDGPMAAASAVDLTIEGSGLASGVYVLVMQGETVRAAQQVTVAR